MDDPVDLIFGSRPVLGGKAVQCEIPRGRSVCPFCKGPFGRILIGERYGRVNGVTRVGKLKPVRNQI
eukprot:scaffold170281_cov29-Tisochrysis_lutea.AAC.7